MRIDSLSPARLLMAALLIFWTGSAAANEQDARAISKLNNQIGLVSTIRSTLERRDAGRATLLLESSRQVIATIETHHLGHAKTFNAFASMKITYLSSKLFLGTFATDYTLPLIDDLNSLTSEILADAGLDDDWPIKQVAAMYENIKKRMDQLRSMRISNELKTKLTELNVHIGTAISVGQAEGDRPPAFEAGNVAYCAIKKLNPDFEAIPGNWPEFEEGVMIRAVAALYADYAKTPDSACR